MICKYCKKDFSNLLSDNYNDYINCDCKLPILVKIYQYNLFWIKGMYFNNVNYHIRYSKLENSIEIFDYKSGDNVLYLKKFKSNKTNFQDVLHEAFKLKNLQ